MKNKDRTYKNYYKDYYRTEVGLSIKIYDKQKKTSKIRKHPAPAYSIDEFQKWLFSQDNFNILYSEWVKSDYTKDLKPSVDRLCNNKGYSFENIQLVTWKDNLDNATLSRMKPVFQYSKSGVLLKRFDSIKEASIYVGTKLDNISACLRGKTKTAKGFIWEYAT